MRLPRRAAPRMALSRLTLVLLTYAAVSLFRGTNAQGTELALFSSALGPAAGGFSPMLLFFIVVPVMIFAAGVVVGIPLAVAGVVVVVASIPVVAIVAFAAMSGGSSLSGGSSSSSSSGSSSGGSSSGSVSETTTTQGTTVSGTTVSTTTSAPTAICTPTTPFDPNNPATFSLVLAATRAASSQDTQTDTSSKAVQDYIAKKHNCLRSVVSPTATNMRKMQWDAEAASLAKVHADACVYAHDANTARVKRDGTNCGQNLAASSNQASWDAIANLWYNEVNKENYVLGTTVVPFENSETSLFHRLGHYTQFVWAETFQVGCSWKECTANNPFGTAFGPTWHLYTCDYCPAGNYPDATGANLRNPYASGTSCSACPTGTTCSENLCAIA